jgi:hypothetical protein
MRALLHAPHCHHGFSPQTEDGLTGGQLFCVGLSPLNGFEPEAAPPIVSQRAADSPGDFTSNLLDRSTLAAKPEPVRVVIAGGYNRFSIGRKLRTGDAAVVPAQRVEFAATPDIPAGPCGPCWRSRSSSRRVQTARC